jgi:hypothetical protein
VALSLVDTGLASTAEAKARFFDLPTFRCRLLPLPLPFVAVAIAVYAVPTSHMPSFCGCPFHQDGQLPTCHAFYGCRWMPVFTDDCSLSQSHVFPFCGCPFRQADAHLFRWMIRKIVVIALLGNTAFTSGRPHQTPNIWGFWLCRTRRRTSDSYILGVAAHLSPSRSQGVCCRVEKPKWAFTQYIKFFGISLTASSRAISKQKY